MIKIIGKKSLNKTYHQKTCFKCGAIIEFNNNDIIRDDMGCEIICPNCMYSIKF